MLGKQARVALFLKQLSAGPPAATAVEAMVLIAATLNGVENEHTDIPFDPTFPRDSGRLYPPKEDARRPVEGSSEIGRYRSAGHDTFVANNGAIRIENLDGKVQLDKVGADGQNVAAHENTEHNINSDPRNLTTTPVSADRD